MRFSAVLCLALSPSLATFVASEDPKPAGGTPVLVELFTSQG
jgi:hypothetical protein